jgi:ankyrin repeat protein
LQETPLHFAAKYGHEEIVSFLLKLPVDTKAVNKHGETASDVAGKSSSDRSSKNRIQSLLSGIQLTTCSVCVPSITPIVLAVFVL